MIRVSCYNCQHGATAYFSAQDWNRRITSESFQYYRCKLCGLIFLSPIPANLGKYYAADYYSFPKSLSEMREAAEAEAYKIEIVRSYVKSGRLLEIGPAVGGFTYLAKRAGFDVSVIEMDENCCRFLRDVIDVRVVHSDDAALSLQTEGEYEVIALWHVIEHLPNPWELLDAAAAKLSPGGVIVIAAPNPDSFQFHVLGRHWAHLDAPRHLFLIPPALLIQHMADLGFEAALVTTNDHGGLGWNQFGWQKSLAHFAPGSLTKRAANKTGRILARVLKSKENHDLCGAAYTIVFQRLDAQP